jgi:anti-sigma-K factor RskA
VAAGTGQGAPVPGLPARRSLRRWQGVAAFASVAALSFATLWLQPAPQQAPIVVVLTPQAAAAGALEASFVASVSADGRHLVLRPVQPLTLEAGRALELWAVPAEGAPRSLGLVSAERGASLVRAGLLQGVAAFAVSLEPAGGSPTGAPTGPILSVGKLSI